MGTMIQLPELIERHFRGERSGITWEILACPGQRYCMPTPAQLSRSGRARTTATAVGLESD